MQRQNPPERILDVTKRAALWPCMISYNKALQALIDAVRTGVRVGRRSGEAAVDVARHVAPRVAAAGFTAVMALPLVSCGGPKDVTSTTTTDNPAGATEDGSDNTSANTVESTVKGVDEAAVDLVQVGMTLDREMRAMSAFGNPETGETGDTNPGRTQILLDVLEGGNVSEDIRVSVQGSDGSRAVVWEDGAVRREGLPESVEKIEISRDSVDVCLTVSATSEQASEVSVGKC